MTRRYQMTEAALMLAILESLSRFLDADDRILAEHYRLSDDNLNENLDSLRNDVRDATRMLKDNPEEFARQFKKGAKMNYQDIIQAIKAALNRNGFTVGTKSPLTGLPTIRRTADIQNERALAEIRRRVIAMQPKLAGGFSGDRRLFRETTLDGKQGYSCSVIGDLISIIARMDGSQLSVVQTGESRYGTPDSPLLEKAFFISLPDDGEA